MGGIAFLEEEAPYAPLLGFKQAIYLQYEQVKFTINIQYMKMKLHILLTSPIFTKQKP